MGKALLLLLLIFVSMRGMAQDIHFSQIHSSPILLNPSFNGLFNGDVRFIMNYRNQWKNVTANYNTYAASVDGKLFALKNSGFINGGINLNTDKAGDLNYSKTQVNGALSFMKSLSRFTDHFVTAGVELGTVTRSVDYSKLNLLDNEYDPLISASNQSTQLDLSAGVSWYYSKRQKFLVYSGLSLYHINAPAIGFSKKNDQQEYLYSRFVYTGGAEIHYTSIVSVLPSVLYLDQGPHREITTGTYIRHRLFSMEEREKNYFYYGMWLRWYTGKVNTNGVDAVVLSVRLDYNHFYYAFSYDMNVSSLSKSSKAQGGPELSVIYILNYGSKGGHSRPNLDKLRKITCPTF